MSTYLDLLLRNTDNIGFKLIPHVEEIAMRYVVFNSVMASRVMVKTDMSGWNVRKVSEYVRSRRAQTLAEDTDIPETNLVRVRKNYIEPSEVGERYRVTNRRSSTDRENILADVVTAIGDAISGRVEVDLMNTALNTFKGGQLGSASTSWTLGLMLQAATIFRAQGRRGSLFHVVHPYQALTEMEKLIEYSNATQQSDLDYRNRAASQLAATADIRSFNLPTFGVTNLAISEMLPRRVTYKLAVDGDGGTFRLQLGDGHVAGTNQTADITYSAVPATMATNIAAAINALPLAVRGGTWAASGSDNLDLTVTPPAGVYHSYADRLRVANKYDEDAVLENDLGTTFMKPYYDEITNPSGAYTDKDGTSMGVVLWERTGATALGLLFNPEAIIWDVRQGVTSFFELTKQGRTAEFSGHMVYGAGDWSPELGMLVETKAEAPNAV